MRVISREMGSMATCLRLMSLFFFGMASGGALDYDEDSNVDDSDTS